MSSSPNESGAEHDNTHGGLQLRFERCGDRLRHEIEVASASGKSLLVMSSIEGDLSPSSNEEWPASPPFQELHEQQIDGRNVAMLVGRAGKSHWSASVTSCTDDRAFVRQLEWDLACRVHELPPEAANTESLGAWYQLGPEISVVWSSSTTPGGIERDEMAAAKTADARAAGLADASAPREVDLFFGEQHLRLSVAVDAPAAGGIVIDGNRIGISIRAGALKLPATLRWKYVVELLTN